MWNKILPVAAVFTLLSYPASADAGGYARIARLSYVEGHVTFQHPNEVDWTDASINLALQPGDRIYTGIDGRVEIEFDEGSVLRLAEGTDVELTSMDENRVQVRVLLGLCTLTRQGNVPFEIDTPAAAFHTLHEGVYRFDVTESGASDGIVRKGSMLASAGNASEKVNKGELIHVEPGDNPNPILSSYQGRDGWDEWTDRRTADQSAYANAQYVPDYVYMGVSDLGRYGRWVDVGPYGYGWVPYYVTAGWSPYWDGRWCYRPYWGWTWVSYEPWGWLPYHYGSWYFSTGFGWCWLPGASFGFHFWSPGLVRFYSGPGWVSWAPLGPGDYYNVNNYYYQPRYSHYLNNMRLVQQRGPDDLVNRHIPGAFRTAPTDQFVNGGGGRSIPAGSVVEVSQPWREGRVVADRLNIAPTSRSYQPVVGSGRTNDGRATNVSVPAVVRSPGRVGVTGPAVERAAPPAASVPGASREAARSASGYAAGAGASGIVDAVNPSASASRGRATQGTVDPAVRIWNRVEDPVATEASRPVSSGPSTGNANPRASGFSVDSQAGAAGRVGAAASRAYEAPRPVVIERGAGSRAESRSYPAGNPSELAPGNAVPPPSSPPASSLSSRTYENRGLSGLQSRDPGRAVQPPAAIPDGTPAHVRPAPQPSQPRSYAPAPSGGNSAARMPSPAWGSGRTQVPSPAGPQFSQPPAWGRGAASAPAMNPGGAPRSAPPGGAAGSNRGRPN
jgi:hypothetical protein